MCTVDSLVTEVLPQFEDIAYPADDQALEVQLCSDAQVQSCVECLGTSLEVACLCSSFIVREDRCLHLGVPLSAVIPAYTRHDTRTLNNILAVGWRQEQVQSGIVMDCLILEHVRELALIVTDHLGERIDALGGDLVTPHHESALSCVAVGEEAIDAEYVSDVNGALEVLDALKRHVVLRSDETLNREVAIMGISESSEDNLPSITLCEDTNKEHCRLFILCPPLDTLCFLERLIDTLFSCNRGQSVSHSGAAFCFILLSHTSCVPSKLDVLCPQ